MRRDLAPKVIGAALGIAVGGWLFVAKPMIRNHAECGRVTLCSEPGR